jgi:hypothetical protein
MNRILSTALTLAGALLLCATPVNATPIDSDGDLALQHHYGVIDPGIADTVEMSSVGRTEIIVLGTYDVDIDCKVYNARTGQLLDSATDESHRCHLMFYSPRRIEVKVVVLNSSETETSYYVLVAH